MRPLVAQTVVCDSLFTRLDFRPKLVLISVITMVAFVWESPLMGGALALVVLSTCLAAGVRPRYLATILKLLTPFALLLILTQGFFAEQLITSRTGLTREEFHMLFELPTSWPLVGGAGLSREGVLYALNIIAKSLTMTLVIPLAVFTTDADTMIVGLVKAGIPYKVAFVFSSTLRFFPLLFSQAQAILEAQRLRGLSMEEMGLVRRARVYARLAIPLILGAMKRSQLLDVALQSRAFSGSSDRTYLHDSALDRADVWVIIVSLLFLAIAAIAYFAFGIGGFGTFEL